MADIETARQLHYIHIPSYTTQAGETLRDLRLSYEVAGCPLGTAPTVLVNHALTGNSSVAEETGWWGSLIGRGRAIDTTRYTILAFNIPGNGYDGNEQPEALRLDLRDVAELFIRGIDSLGIDRLYAIIGASLGGGLSLQIAYLRPRLAEHIFCIASDYRASDWLLAQTLVQQRILDHSSSPIEDARIHAMLCYRTPMSLGVRFAGRSTRTPGKYDIVSWLEYHGDALAARFKLSAYRVMTRLTASIYVCHTAEELQRIEGTVHLVSIDTDLLFTHARSLEAYERLKSVAPRTTLDTIYSIHGHDAFLMEYEQLVGIIAPYFASEASQH